MKFICLCLVLNVFYSCAPQPPGNSSTSAATPEDSSSKIEDNANQSADAKPIVTPEDSSSEAEDISVLAYPFDTLLKNGYHLSYRVETNTTDDEMTQYLFLMKGNRMIAQINANSYGLPFKNLGYIVADFGDTFAFIESYGSGNPHEMRLILKEKGSLLKSGLWVDADESGGILLYTVGEETDVETLMLYDVLNDKEKVILDFKRSECVQENYGGYRNCLEIDTVTHEFVVLKIESEAEKIVKRYQRG